MADTRNKTDQDESSPVAISYELPIEILPSIRPLNAEEIAAFRAFFDLLARWDEALSKRKS